MGWERKRGVSFFAWYPAGGSAPCQVPSENLRVMLLSMLGLYVFECVCMSVGGVGGCAGCGGFGGVSGMGGLVSDVGRRSHYLPALFWEGDGLPNVLCVYVFCVECVCCLGVGRGSSAFQKWQNTQMHTHTTHLKEWKH